MSAPEAVHAEPLVLTVPEVADRLRVAQSFVWALLASGELRSIKIGRTRRVPIGVLHEFIESRLTAPKAGR